MSSQKKPPVLAVVTPMCEQAADALGLELWDVVFVKEGDGWTLRVFIEKAGGVMISDCEDFSGALSDALDEADPIEQSYTLEVSSPGAERALKTDSHIVRYIGSAVDVRFYKAIDGRKSVTGRLLAYENGVLTLMTDDGEISFDRAQAGGIKLHFEF